MRPTCRRLIYHVRKYVLIAGNCVRRRGSERLPRCLVSVPQQRTGHEMQNIRPGGNYATAQV